MVSAGVMVGFRSIAQRSSHQWKPGAAIRTGQTFAPFRQARRDNTRSSTRPDRPDGCWPGPLFDHSLAGFTLELCSNTEQRPMLGDVVDKGAVLVVHILNPVSGKRIPPLIELVANARVEIAEKC